MNNQYGENHDEVIVEGFELPSSPDASYNNLSDFGNDARDPPPLPTHLQHCDTLQPMAHPRLFRCRSMSLSTTSTLKPKMSHIRQWLSGSPIAFKLNLSPLCFIKQAVEVAVSAAVVTDILYHFFSNTNLVYKTMPFQSKSSLYDEAICVHPIEANHNLVLNQNTFKFLKAKYQRRF
ncbi:unnamed protein product [Rhodiola kirilowii]